MASLAFWKHSTKTNTSRKQWAKKFATIAFKIVLLLIIFYSSFFSILSVLTGAFSLVYDASIPFDYKNCCAGETRNIVVVVGMELNFLFCSFLFLTIERLRVWDYALLVCLAHFIFSCIVIREPPDNWQWWIAFLMGSLFMIVTSQVLAVCFDAVQKCLGKSKEPNRLD